MRPRDRVMMALNHEVPDRCPMQVSFTPEFAERLRKELNLAESDLHNPHGGGNTYALERAIGEDMLLTSVGWANSYYQEIGPYTDEWGIGWDAQPYETPFGTGHYTEIVKHPLAGARMAATPLNLDLTTLLPGSANSLSLFSVNGFDGITDAIWVLDAASRVGLLLSPLSPVDQIGVESVSLGD